jgi:hypothetical protein
MFAFITCDRGFKKQGINTKEDSGPLGAAAGIVENFLF